MGPAPVGGCHPVVPAEDAETPDADFVHGLLAAIQAGRHGEKTAGLANVAGVSVAVRGPGFALPVGRAPHSFFRPNGRKT